MAQLGVPLSSEAITRQQLIRRMKLAHNRAGGPKSHYIGHCSMTCISGEFAAFLGEGDTQFLVDLTDWYDSRDKWTYDTKHGGTDEIVGVCFNILGAMAPDWIPHCIPQGAIGGGFTSRLLWVVSQHKERLIPNPNSVELDEGLEQDIIHDLEMIHSLQGEFVLHREAMEWYEEWYIREENRVAAGEFPLKDPRFQGYISRRATHIKKIAMCLATARCNDLLITQPDIEAAVTELEGLEKDFGIVFAGVGNNPTVQPTNAIIEIIKERSVKKSEIARTFYTDLDITQLEQVEQMLVAMRRIKVRRDPMSEEVLWISLEKDPKSTPSTADFPAPPEGQ